MDTYSSIITNKEYHDAYLGNQLSRVLLLQFLLFGMNLISSMEGKRTVYHRSSLSPLRSFPALLGLPLEYKRLL